MKTTSAKILMLLFAAGLLISCHKESIKHGSENTQLLTEHTWQYDQFGIDENLDGMIDIVEGFEECAQDDIVKFNSGGSGSFDQGSNFCYTGYPQSMAFDWKFQNNETQIEYGGTVHNILQLDEEQMAIYTEESDGSSTIRHILVYRH